MNIAWKNIGTGDKDAYSEAYLLIYDRYYNYGMKFTPEVALVEDAIQEVLLSIWLSREKLPGIQNPEAYFFSSFRNNLFRKLKESSKTLPVEMGNWEPEFAKDALMIHHELGEELRIRLQKALDTLTSRQREAVYFRFYEGLSYEEVAATLGVSVKATYKIMARALLELRRSVPVPMAILFTLLRQAKI